MDDVAAPKSELGLTFPDGPRTRLDELLAEMTTVAEQVRKTQGRLRSLLSANAAIVSDLSLPVVLRQIVTVACQLLDARYAALGVIDGEGGLEQFIHVGMDEDAYERIGHLPAGKGLLGQLISDPTPLRLSEIGTHPASVGFPEGHPPMHSFLGVPIVVRGRVFGNLYLTESRNAEFSDEDEQLAVALAASAGVAIENARLYEDVERRRRWQALAADAGQAPFTGAGDPVERVLNCALEAGDADVALLVRRSGGRLQVAAGVGEPFRQLVSSVLHLDETLSDEVFVSDKSIAISDVAAIGAVHPALADMTSVMLAPLRREAETEAAILLARSGGRGRFDATDRDKLADFAAHVGMALQLDRARADQEQLRTLQERERIAADLHDHVIQDLFTVGMGLQSRLARYPSDEQERISGYIDTLDTAIHRIRDSIFHLQHANLTTATKLRQQLLDVVDQHIDALGFAPGVTFSGLLHESMPAAIADDAVAVVHEALSNVGRHAHATSVDVFVSHGANLLIIEIRDDGVGIGTPSRSSGLSNLRQRAERHGGTFTVEAPPSGGTALRWTAATAG